MRNFSKKKLLEAVEKFKDKKVFVVGDVLLDKYVYGTVDRINPENPGAHLLKINKEEYRLGGAGNVAMNIASLNASASLISIIGEDKEGFIVERLCLDNEIDTFFVRRRGESIVKERYIESDHNHYILRADYGETTLNSIDGDLVNNICEGLRSSNFDALILSDYNKIMFKGDLGARLIEFAREKKVPVVVDSKPANILSFRHATLVCPNLKEAREITGMFSASERELAERIRKIAESDYVIVTCGKKGMVCYGGLQYNEIPTNTRGVVDVTGAGDTARAAMALGLISGLNLHETTYLANYAAGVVVEKQGTATVSLDELRKRIREDS